MTDHPLTNEMIEEIAQFEPDLTDRLRLNRTNDMRAAYDRGRDDQLKQVIEWIEDEGFYDHITYDPDYGVQTYDSGFIANLKKAMRPQEDN